LITVNYGTQKWSAGMKCPLNAFARKLPLILYSSTGEAVFLLLIDFLGYVADVGEACRIELEPTVQTKTIIRITG
jgi:hypothetical protein